MKGKHRGNPKKIFGVSKILVLSIALALVFCTVVGTTVAWLVANTKPVVNTFTYGDINIKLNETDTNLDGDNDANTNRYPMIPGNTIDKDPAITVMGGSEDCWLFVKLEKTSNFDDFITFEVADGWLALDGVDGVYYTVVDKSDTDTRFEVINNNTVTVKQEVTKEMLNALDIGGINNYPKLTITAYAVQRDGNIATAADAWSKIG